MNIATAHDRARIIHRARRRAIPAWVEATIMCLAGALLGALAAWVLFGRVIGHFNTPWGMATGDLPEAIRVKMEADGAIGYISLMGTMMEQMDAGIRWFLILTVAGGFAGWKLWRRTTCAS